MGIGRPQAAGASSPVILSAAKNPSPVVHPFQRPPRIPRRDEHLCPSWVSAVRIPAAATHPRRRGGSYPTRGEPSGLRSKQSPAGRSSRVRCIAPVAASEPGWICLRQIAFVPNAGTLTLAGKSVPYGERGTRTAGCRPYGERGARSDVGILRDSSSSLPTETACRGGHWPPACGRGFLACHSERSEESVPPRPREKGVRILRFR